MKKILPWSNCWGNMDTDLLFLQPFFQQLLPTLHQDRSAQLQRLVLVELALVQQNAKVLQQGGRLTGLRRHLLELLNGLWGP